MFFMSNSLIFCQNIFLSMNISSHKSFSCCNAPSTSGRLSCGRPRTLRLYAKRRHSKKKSWWQRFFFDEGGNWLGLKDEDVLDVLEPDDTLSEDDEQSENEKFELWKQRAEAIVELSEAQKNGGNEGNRMWEDWIIQENDNEVRKGVSWYEETNGANEKQVDDIGEDGELFSGRGLVKSFRDAILGRDDAGDDLQYEDRVFRYASLKSAKFLAVLIIVPWGLDFFVHDYVLLPFLDRYVKTVPLAAEMLDVRRNQKLEIFKDLNLEKARYRLEVEIGKSPPLSDKELYEEIRHKALQLRDEKRLENRKAFANIWSDMVFGISLFILLCCCQDQVALLKFTGYKILNNISDTGKAFAIILITDIFLGYHSESGWQTLIEVIVEHYGFEIDQAAITIFVCLIPVVIDACVKLWLFKFLPRLSPKVANIFQEMKRH